MELGNGLWGCVGFTLANSLVQAFTSWRHLDKPFVLIKFILKYLVHFESTVRGIFFLNFNFCHRLQLYRSCSVVFTLLFAT